MVRGKEAKAKGKEREKERNECIIYQEMHGIPLCSLAFSFVSNEYKMLLFQF